MVSASEAILSSHASFAGPYRVGRQQKLFLAGRAISKCIADPEGAIAPGAGVALAFRDCGVIDQQVGRAGIHHDEENRGQGIVPTHALARSGIPCSSHQTGPNS